MGYIPFPNKKYNIIYADPPWKYNGVWGSGSKKALVQGKANEAKSIPYPCMSIEEIKNLQISSIADDNCELYLWTTQKYLPVVFEVIKSWGFKYCQTLTWCKTPMGTGQCGVFCPTTEFLILARRGKSPVVERINTTWWNVKRQKRHSKKPDFFRDLIVSIYGDIPRIELFARQKTEGWDVWGNEV